MKTTILSVIALCLTAAVLQAKELKVLMIGNSFSESVLTCLPEIVKAEGHHKLFLTQMFIGGCSIERHIDELKKAEQKPEYKPYRTNFPGKKRTSLPEMISAEKWDIVTIQQSSFHSWQPEKMQPFADWLITYIRKNAPQAEIVVHQTWACRIAEPSREKWADRFKIVEKNYDVLARKHGLRIIPVGKAVQNFRTRSTWKPADISKYQRPEVPPFSGDLAWHYYWRKKQDGNYELKLDNAHLTNEGCYLQACVWYGFLFEENPSGVKFIPGSMDMKLAKMLRECAAEALGKKQ